MGQQALISKNIRKFKDTIIDNINSERYGTTVIEQINDYNNNSIISDINNFNICKYQSIT